MSMEVEQSGWYDPEQWLVEPNQISDSECQLLDDEYVSGPGNLVHDEHGTYRILGNTLDADTYSGSAKYVTSLLVKRNKAGQKRVITITSSDVS